MNFKDEYRKYMEKIQPDRTLTGEVRRLAREMESDRRWLRARAVKNVLTAVSACICLCIGIPTAAANVDPVYRLMLSIAPKTAQYFRLIQNSDEEQGIRMEVLAAYIHGNELQALISLQDLEGGRIDETTDIGESLALISPFPVYGGGGYQPVDFDSETGTASFLITLGQIPDQEGSKADIIGEKLVLSLRRIISQKKEYEDLEIPIPWSEIQENPKTMSLHLSGRSGAGSSGISQESSDPRPVGRMLLPSEPDLRLPVDEIHFTGMGYIDGMLHIQTAAPDNLKNDNHCTLFLVDREGNRRQCDYKINAFGDTPETKHISYQDCIFDISPEELENYTLHGHFVISGFYTEGNWSVTFPVEGEAQNPNIL